jgi:hypothetical protein
MPYESFAGCSKQAAYPRPPRTKRIGQAEAMMERDAGWRQLDLLTLSSRAAIQSSRLDPSSRQEITAILKLLIEECVTGALLGNREIVDEQDHD